MIFSKDIIGFASQLIVLMLLKKDPDYGYSIIRRVKSLSQGKLILAEGSLYPLLEKMRKQRLLRSRWQQMTGDRKRKYYIITSRGMDMLSKKKEEWHAMDMILKAHANSMDSKIQA
jgi:DNA-binding PadR family transcriptional regulator